MANRILNDIGWQQRILDKLGVDVAYLPFAAIEQPECITVAEANIIKQVPDYASLTDDDKVYLEAAVVCECGVLLCLSMPTRMPKKEQGPHMTTESQIDWEKNKSDLEIERDGYIGSISTVSILPLLHFGISNPERGW